MLLIVHRSLVSRNSLFLLSFQCPLPCLRYYRYFWK
jgi:hypothetical protein